MTRQAGRRRNRHAAAQAPVWGTRYRVIASIFSLLASVGCYGMQGSLGQGSEGVVGTIMLACSTMSMLGWACAALMDAQAALHHLSGDENRLVQCLAQSGRVYTESPKPARWRFVRPRVLRGERGCVSAQIAIVLGILTFIMTNLSYEAQFVQHFPAQDFLALMMAVSVLLALAASAVDRAVRNAAREFRAMEERIGKLQKRAGAQQAGQRGKKSDHPAPTTDERLTKRNLELQEQIKELQQARQGQAEMIANLQAENARLKAEAAKPRPAPRKRPGTGTAASPGEETGESGTN